MTSQGVDGTLDKAGRILPDSNQRVKDKNKLKKFAIRSNKYRLVWPTYSASHRSNW